MKIHSTRKLSLASRWYLLAAAILCFILSDISARAEFLWSERIASVANWPEDEPNIGLTLDTNDNCYVTGNFDGTNDFGGVTLTNQSAGGSDIFVAKYNSTGALQWVQQAGQSVGNINYGRAVGADTNGNIYVTGGYQGPAAFGDTNLPVTWGEQFFLAKYAGLAAALTLLSYVNLIGVMLASWMSFDTYGRTDLTAIGIFAAGIVLAYALAGFSNFFLRRPFVSDAVLALVVFATLAAFVIFRFTNQMETAGVMAQVDWRLVPAGILILFALWILAALALACSTRLDTIPTLAICSAFFLIGLMSDYFYWKAGGKPGVGGPWWASTLYTIVPNWQLFWFADALDMGKSMFHWGYVGKAFAYVIAYAGAALAVGTALFEDRELS